MVCDYKVESENLFHDTSSSREAKITELHSISKSSAVPFRVIISTVMVSDFIAR